MPANRTCSDKWDFNTICIILVQLAIQHLCLRHCHALQLKLAEL